MSNHPHPSTLLGTHQVPYQLTLLHTLPMTHVWHKNHSTNCLANFFNFIFWILSIFVDQVPYQLYLITYRTYDWILAQKSFTYLFGQVFFLKILLIFVEINSWKSVSFGLLLQIHKYKVCFACLFFNFWNFGKLNLKLSNLFFFSFSFF
jgi:hypothetical protein